MKKLSVSWLLAAMLLWAGCVETGTKKPGVARLLPNFNGTYEIAPDMEKNMPRSVAVLPFVDESGSQKGREVVRIGFYNHFSSLPFHDMEMQRMDKLLVMEGLADPKAAHAADPKRLGKLLGVDALVLGRVSNFDKLFAVIYSHVNVGAEVTMVDARTGNLLWKGKHNVVYREGGVPLSIAGALATVFATAMNMREIQLLRACDDLFRDMVQTIPVPKMGAATLPPKITLLAQDTLGKPKKAGDKIQFAMQGDPNNVAWVDIGDFKKKIPMDEVEPGGYLAVYTVMPGDNVTDATVTGYLSDKAGNTAQWIDPVSTVTLDTTPPQVPRGLFTTGADGQILLKWEKNAEPDLAGYRVFQSATPLSGFEPAGDTEFSRWEAAGVPNYQARYFKLAAFDRAGNVSRQSEAVEGMAVLPGPTRVSGPISKDTTWWSGSGPYVLEGTVTVADTATLVIQPGTAVVSKGAALVVHGKLSAAGTPEAVITFGGDSGAAWDGLVFDQTAGRENTVRFCRVSGATRGVTCRASSPRLTACELTANKTGVLVSGAFSKPKITGCAIKENQGAGIVVEDGSRPSVLRCVIQKNSGPGVWIKSGAPEVSENDIFGNLGSGILAEAGEALVTKNNLHDNAPANASGPAQGKALAAPGNWWGTALGRDVLGGLKGRVAVASVLDAAFPDGKSLAFPALEGPLSGNVQKDGFLLAAFSPYRVKGEVALDNGATLAIQPGVVLQYEPGASLVVQEGGIIARGTAESPIMFTSAGASPAPGDYKEAVRFAGQNPQGSFFEYCVVRYASIGFAVEHGSPEISRCQISDNYQGGIRCVNDASPKVLYCTITRNTGSGGIECQGMSNPKLHHNNIMDNAFGIQALSSIHIDARDNYWGASPADGKVIWGDNVNFTPWLEAMEKDAFSLPAKK